MGIIQAPLALASQVGVIPSTRKMVTTDNLATVTAAGYLNSVNLEGFPVSTNDVIEAFYSYNTVTQTGTYAQFGVSISGTGVITLSVLANPGDVLLPVVSGDFANFNGTSGQIRDAGFSPTNPAKTKVIMANGAVIANHIAVYTDTAGTIDDDAATAINGGNIQAGLSGTAGTLISFPTTAATGSLIVAGVSNSGNTNTTISNASMGQASVVSIPDPVNATARFLVGATATPFVSGNFPVASGTGGLMVDSGIPAASIATTSTAVLLTPAADQTITIHNLTVAAGSVTAGSSGNAGRFASFPATAANGSLIVEAIDAGAAFNTTISNSVMGQSSAVSIPDPGAATANFLLDTGAANILAQQEFVGLSDVLDYSVGTWTTTRIAQGNYAQTKGQADETAIIGIDITPMIRTAASKGFRLDSFDVVYGITTLALDAHSVTLDRIAYADNVAVSITSIPITGTLATATQANPYVTSVTVDTPAFDITADSKYVIEVTVNAGATSDYAWYGLMLKFSQTIG